MKHVFLFGISLLMFMFVNVDVVELYDDNGSEFYYVDRFGFKEIDFESQDHRQDMNMSM